MTRQSAIARLTGLFGEYEPLLAARRRLSASAVALLGLAASCEGLALTALLPLIEESQAGSDRSEVTKTLLRLGVSEERLVLTSFILFVTIALVSASAKLAGEAAVLRLHSEVEEDMRRETTDAVLDIRWTSFVALRVGDIGKSIISEGMNAGVGAQALVRAVGAGLATLVFIALAFVLSVGLTAFAAVFALLSAVGYRLVGAKAAAETRKLSAVASDMNDFAFEYFGGLKYFLSTASRERARERARMMYSQFRRGLFRSQIYGVGARYVFEALGVLFVTGVLAISWVNDERLTADALIFLGVFYRIVPRALTVQEGLYQARAQQSWVNAWRTRLELLRANVDIHTGREPARFDNVLRVNGVTFVYPASRQGVTEMSFEIRRGECIALVGASGSGKTTMMDLLTGLLPPDAGSITVDDTPLTAIDRDDWQRHIGLVMQEAPLFKGTIAENIAWHSGEVDRERLTSVATAAHVTELVDRLPNGFDTVVGERGANLSGGQRQRIALARALYREPWLLILDEATSALDATSERLIQGALTSLKGSCAMVVVAHRLRTVQLADTIHVLKDGRIVETGEWHTLLAADGVFAELARDQALT